MIRGKGQGAGGEWLMADWLNNQVKPQRTPNLSGLHWQSGVGHDTADLPDIT